MLYDAWLDSDKHGLMTGGQAEIDPAPGGLFSAWDDYISGSNTRLEENTRIVQAWRTVEFAEDDRDSKIEIILAPDGDGTLVTLRHAGIPDGQPDYRQGWIDNYFEPMHDYFGDLEEE